MPNGGSDCCGTCWFNGVNNGIPGFPEKSEVESIKCEIRDFVPEIPFWTYCANHPHHNMEKITTPIGPVYVCKEDTYGRVEKTKPLDGEDIRKQLVSLIERVPEVPASEYPTPTKFVIEVIKHIAFIKERRAKNGLVRILSFEPFSQQKDDKFSQNNVLVIANAIEALAIIDPLNTFEIIQPWVKFGLPVPNNKEYESHKDRCAPLRYHAVRALKYIESEFADKELYDAVYDPHPEVQLFAKEILRIRKNGA